MTSKVIGEAFEGLIFEILKELGFDVSVVSQYPTNKYQPDLKVLKEDFAAYCEVKFYRSSKVSRDYLIKASDLLAEFKDDAIKDRILIVSCYVDKIVKDTVELFNGVIIWDRSNIANFLAAKGTSDYLEQLGMLIREFQQGTDADSPYEFIEDTNTDYISYFSKLSEKKSVVVEKEGARLIIKLDGVKIGKAGWSEYENVCIECLQYLFKEDLFLWEKQLHTDDELSRYDLICRIGSTDDFWKTLVQSFSSRYILFEFKNYTDPLPQSQIYTTERYLYPQALRGACIIIARKGINTHALSASKGALRENGKLILTLNNEDLKNMLQGRDLGNSPNDYLSNLLDQFLISLSR